MGKSRVGPDCSPLYPTTSLRLSGIAEIKKWQNKMPTGVELGDLQKHLTNASLYTAPSHAYLI